jgi:hypothetical protein
MLIIYILSIYFVIISNISSFISASESHMSHNSVPKFVDHKILELNGGEEPTELR